MARHKKTADETPEGETPVVETTVVEAPKAETPVVEKPKSVAAPLSMREINARMLVMQNKNNQLTEAIHRLSEDVKKMLHKAFDEGDDVTKYTVELVVKK